MNILYYFLGMAPFNDGGMTIYARDLALAQQKNGHKVMMLMPGRNNQKKKFSDIRFFRTQEGLRIFELYNAQILSYKGFHDAREFFVDKSHNKYRSFFEKNSIDVLHIHSLLGLPIELIDEANRCGIKTIFTTHDYFGICPTINLYKYDQSICRDYGQGQECVKCNSQISGEEVNREVKHWNLMFNKHYSLIKRIYNIGLIKKTIQKIRNHSNRERAIIVSDHLKTGCADQYVQFRNYYKKLLMAFNLIIFNSEVTRTRFAEYIDLEKTKHYVLPVTHANIVDNRNRVDYSPTTDGKIVFVFMGYLNRKKGFFDLIDVLEAIRLNYQNWRLEIYGDYSDLDISKFDEAFYQFKGRYESQQLPDIFASCSTLIIPSKLNETFGLIGLEAYSFGIPAIVSENVGFSMLIQNNINGIVYKENGSNEYLSEALLNVLNDPARLFEYNRKINSGLFTFGMTEHAEKIASSYKDIE